MDVFYIGTAAFVAVVVSSAVSYVTWKGLYKKVEGKTEVLNKKLEQLISEVKERC